MGIINQFLNGVNHWKSMAIEIVDFPMFPLKMVIFPWIARRIFPVTTNFRNLRLPSRPSIVSPSFQVPSFISFFHLKLPKRCFQQRMWGLIETYETNKNSIDLLFQLIPYFGGIMNSIYKLYKGVVHQITKALTDTRKNSMNNPGNVRLVSCQSASAGRTAPI